MAAPAAPVATLAFSGPPQQGREVQGQYVNWIVMPHPTAETLAQTDVKKPSDFNHESWLRLPGAAGSGTQQ